ncbi:unnamed protein product [Moneuplotes crassus]|uniref:JmjC domain-containing protein n=1 Tax=Euplotes crassus TaxID=5936 RepID=A0AAD1XC83_EUPCR|nr:unnamed protein product [Moneuplotes crassus]
MPFDESLVKAYGLDQFEEFQDLDLLRQQVKQNFKEKKKLIRPDFSEKDWEKAKLASIYNSTEEGAPMGRYLTDPEENIPRVHCDDLSVEDFIENYQIPNKPVIIEGCADDWPAMKSWNFKQLYEDFGEVDFEIGEDEIGTPVTVKLKEYLQYMVFNHDDSPMYLFHRNLHKCPEMKRLLEDYEVPKYFREDYQQIFDEKYKPDYNWFLIGPRRSGSYVHYDPFSMSAWNTSLFGHKRWILFEPDMDRAVVEGEEFKTDQNLDNYTAIDHVLNIYPKLLESGLVKKKYEFVQKKGDTIFLPSKWWHVVLNVDDTIAITQNFTNQANFEKVWRSFRRTKKRSACNWLRNMKIYNKDLYHQALKLNEQDDYKMYDYYMSRNEPWPLSPASSQTESSEDLTDYEFDYSSD